MEENEIAAAENIAEIKEKEEEKLCEFQFNVTIPEEDDAFREFQRRYVFKKNVIKSIGFGLLAVGFLVSAILYPKQVMNYILFSISLAAVVLIWYNNRHIRTSLMEALKMLEDDRYIFTLFEDKFRIETIVPEEDREAEDFQEIPPQEFELGDPMLESIEKQDKFVIIVRKQTIYVLPKRCMSESDMEAVRKKLKTVSAG